VITTELQKFKGLV